MQALSRSARLASLGWLAALVGCSGGPSTDIVTGGSGGNAVQLGRGGASGVSGSQGSNGSVGGTSQSCADSNPDVCAGANFEVESIPLDIYVMFDQSGSMLNDVGGMTRLAAVQQAMASFLRDPNSTGISVGIGYFGFQPIGQVSCDAGVYTKPDVSVSLDHEAVISSLSKRMPTGETPTAAALQGACSYAQEHRDRNPGRAVVILLVTDGKPEAPVSCSTGGCCPTLDEATREAKACLSSKQQIPTYVLGVGPNLDNLHAIAQAGGTKMAYLVGDQDVSSRVLSALNDIRRAAQLPCKIEIPTSQSGAVDLERVNVLYAKEDCQFSPIYYVARADACSNEGGWHFDNASSPSFIELCAKSCEAVSSSASALKISVGCARVEPPIR
ncbi:MAG: vWA domain-containing protein [Myxococcota bacterium]